MKVRYAFSLTLALAFLVTLSTGSADAKSLRVRISGVGGDIKNNVESYLSINRLADEKNPSESQIRYFHDRAEEEIRLALQPFGYYRPTTAATLEETSRRFEARYQIDPGAALEIDTLDIRIMGPGKEDPALQKIVQRLGLEQGARLEHSVYERAKTEIGSEAYELGFFDGKFEAHEIAIDLERYTCRVSLHYQTGPRYRYGPVRFEETVVDRPFLEGHVRFQEGDPIEYSELRDLQGSLRNTGYFSRVEVQPRVSEAESLRVPIDVRFVPGKRARIDLGVGAGSDEGPRATVGLELRRINSKGHRASGQFRISRIERRVSAAYNIPWSNPPTAVLSFSGGYQYKTTDARDTEIGLFGIQFAHLRGKWQESIAMTIRREDYTVGPDTGSAWLFGPELQWARTKANDRIYTSRGFRVRLGTTGALEGVLSTSSYMQANAEVKGIHGRGRHRFIGRATGGHTITDEFRELPASIRYFSGGATSVRGYEFESLGPTDGTGQSVGGRSLLELSTEYEYRFYKQWSTAIFFDIGNAFDQIDHELAQGAGFGIRWLSPVGPIRLDLAWALTTDGVPSRIHFNLGPDL